MSHACHRSPALFPALGIPSIVASVRLRHWRQDMALASVLCGVTALTMRCLSPADRTGFQLLLGSLDHIARGCVQVERILPQRFSTAWAGQEGGCAGRDQRLGRATLTPAPVRMKEEPG